MDNETSEMTNKDLTRHDEDGGNVARAEPALGCVSHAPLVHYCVIILTAHTMGHDSSGFTLYIKGWGKKPSFFKIWYTIFSWTVGLKRLSFSGLGVLMRTPSPEKDNLLRPTVPKKIVYQILKKEFFLPHPLLIIVLDIIKIRAIFHDHQLTI